MAAAKRRRRVEDESGGIRRFLLQHIQERIETLDHNNRKGLDLREYHINVGGIRELTRLEGEIEALIKQYNSQQDNDDV